jgi:TolB-like protein/DNA-binding SARP family transcriptional activator
MGGARDETDRVARWSLRLFGHFELCALDTGARIPLTSKRDRALLAYLALSSKGRQPRRKLANFLWDESADDAALDNLRVCVWSLRKALGDREHSVLTSDGDDLMLDISAFETDAVTFQTFLNRPEEVSLLEAGVGLYRGEFLDGLTVDSEAFETWRRSEAVRFNDEAVGALTRLLSQLKERGELEQAIRCGNQLLRCDPLHETAVRELMRLYGATGRRGTVTQLYQTFADTISATLGVAPETETQEVYKSIVSGSERREQNPTTDAGLEHRNSLTTQARSHPADLPPGVVTGSNSHSRSPATRQRRWMFASGIAAALIITLIYQFVQSASTTTGIFPATATARAISFAPSNTISVAVLPFKNLSEDAGQDLFTDGVTEEITSALARIQDLHVVARTSAFEFKGRDENIQEIAQALHATHLIEGSVRKAGDRIRITAQLIGADSGLEIWSDNYDLQLVDIFAIQEEIAQAVAKAVRVPLELAPGEVLVEDRNIDPDTYEQFLHAKSLRHQRGLTGLLEAIERFEDVVSHAPNYAPAWAQLALVYQNVPFIPFAQESETISIEEKSRAADEWLPKAEAAAQQAIQLDPKSSDAYSAWGGLRAFQGRYQEAEELLVTALALDPLSPDTLHRYNNLLGAVGRTQESLAIKQQLLRMEPFVYSYNGGIRDLLWINGQTDSLITRLAASRSGIDLAYLARIYWCQGRYGEALDALNAIPSESYHREMVEDAVQLLQSSLIDPTPPRDLPQLGRRLDFVYVHVGAPERALQRFEDDVAAGFLPPNLMIGLWIPTYAAVRKTERFKAFAREAGLVDYWRARGWPDLCRPVGDDDFECD